MPQENVEVVQRWIAAFEADADAFEDTLDPEIEWFPFESNHTPSRGIEGAMGIREGWLDAWDEMLADLEDVAERGDHVVASVHVTGRGRTSGIEVDVRLHLHFKFRAGKIVYIYEHEDKAAALAAAGLSE
jgi:ketosteroid isomerase-like protein